MQNNKQLEDFSDEEIEAEYESRYLGEHEVNAKIEDFGDDEIIQEIAARGLEDDILEYTAKEVCESILLLLNSNKDVPRQLIVELIQNVTGKIVCK